MNLRQVGMAAWQHDRRALRAARNALVLVVVSVLMRVSMGQPGGMGAGAGAGGDAGAGDGDLLSYVFALWYSTPRSF